MSRKFDHRKKESEQRGVPVKKVARIHTKIGLSYDQRIAAFLLLTQQVNIKLLVNTIACSDDVLQEVFRRKVFGFGVDLSLILRMHVALQESSDSNAITI